MNNKTKRALIKLYNLKIPAEDILLHQSALLEYVGEHPSEINISIRNRSLKPIASALNTPMVTDSSGLVGRFTYDGIHYQTKSEEGTDDDFIEPYSSTPIPIKIDVHLPRYRPTVVESLRIHTMGLSSRKASIERVLRKRRLIYKDRLIVSCKIDYDVLKLVLGTSAGDEIVVNTETKLPI